MTTLDLHIVQTETRKHKGTKLKEPEKKRRLEHERRSGKSKVKYWFSDRYLKRCETERYKKLRKKHRV